MILSSAIVQEYIINYARSFIYTTSLPGASISILNASFDHIESHAGDEVRVTIFHSFVTVLETDYGSSGTGTPARRVRAPPVLAGRLPEARPPDPRLAASSMPASRLSQRHRQPNLPHLHQAPTVARRSPRAAWISLQGHILSHGAPRRRAPQGDRPRCKPAAGARRLGLTYTGMGGNYAGRSFQQ